MPSGYPTGSHPRPSRQFVFTLETWIRAIAMPISLYDTDFHAWTLEQLSLLQSQQFEQLDRLNLIEEVESLGRKERQELRNRLGILLGHLLKWQFQPEQRTNNWLGSIREQRIQIKLLLQDSPSLKPYLEQAFADAYELGLALAIRETLLDAEIFPEQAPYGLEQALENGFLPGKEA
jgi:Domain of unknown function DUF29